MTGDSADMQRGDCTSDRSDASATTEADARPPDAAGGGASGSNDGDANSIRTAEPTETQVTSGWDALSERASTLAGVLAPTTVVTAVLYYFGYVATYSRFAFFGIDLAMLGLSTQEVILQSAAVMFVPLATLLGLGIVLTLINRLTNRALVAESSRARTRRRALLRAGGTAAFIFGMSALGRGVAGVLTPLIAQTEFPGLTPFSLSIGTISVAYGARLLAGTRTYPLPRNQGIKLMSSGILILSLFWMANTFASAYGRGQAVADLQRLTDRPAVTVDTKESLHLVGGCATEEALPGDADSDYKFRYQSLRLLIEGGKRLFLVSENWGLRCAIIVLADDDSIRLQLRR